MYNYIFNQIWSAFSHKWTGFILSLLGMLNDDMFGDDKMIKPPPSKSFTCPKCLNIIKSSTLLQQCFGFLPSLTVLKFDVVVVSVNPSFLINKEKSWTVELCFHCSCFYPMYGIKNVWVWKVLNWKSCITKINEFIIIIHYRKTVVIKWSL